jgi:hypothetical protein
MKLLNTNGGNTKVAKSMKSTLGTDKVRIASLSLMPNIQLCPAQEVAGCKEACLVSAGRGKMSNVAKGRERKTEWFMSDRDGFLAQLRKEMHSFIKTCKRQGVQPVFRLNTISDIQWENLLDLEGEFGDAFYYDYTKLAKRLFKRMPSNYKLMFSYSPKPEFWNQVDMALDTDVPISVVFRGALPKRFLGRDVIDGDESDIVNVQKGAVIVGLRAKGDALGKAGDGFVVDTANRITVS